MLAAGTEADAYCANGKTATSHYAWIAWYPGKQVRVSVPVIHPGDMVYVQVWSLSDTTARAYFSNISTGEVATYALTAPKGTSLEGYCGEWIVGRPTINGVRAPLMNYVEIAMPNGVAWNYADTNKTYYYPGANPPAGDLYLWSMVDSQGTISAPTIENSHFIWFRNAGSSYKK